MDGIDAALIQTREHQVELIASLLYPWPESLHAELKAIVANSRCSLEELGSLDARCGEVFAAAVLALLEKSGKEAINITGIGSHGQTLCHGPESASPFTLQIGDPNRITELTGITTVADFRRRDIAAGGQGAPLVPLFHQQLIGDAEADHLVLNIGGIANLTILEKNTGITGFDTGPGNCLLDNWAGQHLDKAYDHNGDWAATGEPDQGLLEAMRGDPYFHRETPKSTGTEYFSAHWLQKHLEQHPSLPAHHVQATLSQLTGTTIADAINNHDSSSQHVFVCGGGVHNQNLMKSLQALLPDRKITSTASLGIDPDWIEAMAFAWLASQTLSGNPGNAPAVTGASHPAILGGIYPA